jgi:predicted P-loop ATPase
MSSIDFNSIKQQLLIRAESILLDICPGGKRNGNEYRAGSIEGGPGDSFGFNLQNGKWADFAVKGHEGTGIIDLYIMITGQEFKDALKYLKETYLSANQERIRSAQSKPKKEKIEPVRPPHNIEEPSFQHFQLGKPSMVHTYKDENNNPLYYVLRYETEKDGKPDKEHRPLAYFSDNKWHWKAWKDNRPLYGLELLKQNPTRKILIVEGEKAADAARRFIPKGYNILTWQGGVNAISKTDWTPLKDKEILLWPDADEPGLIAMREITELLLSHVKELKIINPDKDNGWDAADAEQEGMTQTSFIEWVKKNIKSIKDPNNKELVLINDRRKKITQIKSTYPHVDLNSDDLKPLSTIDNFQHLLNGYNIIVRNNMLTKAEEILIPDELFSEEGKENAQLAYIKSIASLHSFPLGQIEEFLKYVANKNQYNPVATWIKSTPWDKIERLKNFSSTIKAHNEDQDPKVKWIKETLIKRWMISAVAAVFNPYGVSAHGALVLQGKQGSGKTYWFKKLVPQELKFAKDGITLRTDDKDSIMQALSFWLVELGEVDATFRKSDISQLKGFITRDSDTFRMPFARRESTYARRTVFFASVNPRQFLHDETGNRRFWTIECDQINYMHEFDMQQIWAEVYENHYIRGEPWVLQQDEKDYLDGHNEDFKALDPIEELIEERLDWDSNKDSWEDRTITEVLISCGKKNPNKADLNSASNLIKKLNGNQVTKTKYARLVKVPKLKTEYRLKDELGFS